MDPMFELCAQHSHVTAAAITAGAMTCRCLPSLSLLLLVLLFLPHLSHFLLLLLPHCCLAPHSLLLLLLLLLAGLGSCRC
jgi:hypothetical protein